MANIPFAARFIMRWSGRIGLASILCMTFSACEQRLSDAPKQLPAAEAQAFKLASEYWAKEAAPCVLADNCRLKVEEVDAHQCRFDAEDQGKKWMVSLSQGEGIDGSSYVTCIDKVTGEISDTYWVVF